MRFVRGFLGFIAALFVLETAFAIHEYGHLTEYRKRGVPVEEFSLGIGWLVYRYEGEEFAVSFRAVPIMAYVAPTDEGAKLVKDKFPFWSKVAISSAGVRNNIVVALVVVIFLQILGWRRGSLTGAELVRTILSTPAKVVLRYLAFMIGCITLGRVKLADRFCLSTGGINPPKLVKWFIAWNLLLGIFNLAPLLPLDGGKIALEMLPLLTNNAISEEFLVIAGFFLFIPFSIIANMQDVKVLEIELEK